MNPAFGTGEAPLTVTFASTATGAETINWNFGDGKTATGATVTHTFTELKTYTVTQTVSNVGGSASYSQTVTPIHTATPI
jgi:PKD repeat protein